MSQKKRIVYITRDIERALGMEPGDGSIIVTNRTPYAETFQKEHPEWVHIVDTATESPADSVDLLKSDTVRKLMADPDRVILVFKNNPLIEAVTRENAWTLLNPSAALAEKIENKISQVGWLGELATRYMPHHEIATLGTLVWRKEPLVVQWAHGHSGDGTVVVNSAAELAALQKKFPDRPARASVFVNGPSFTVNVIVGLEDISIGTPSYQITGLPPFTDNPLTTVGNDWSLTHSLLSEMEISGIETMARDIGEKMRADGWRGLFGIDLMRDDERGGMFLIEINARQPASTTFESILQRENRRQGIEGSTLFEAHRSALLGESRASALIPVNDGAQIIQRVTAKIRSISDDAVGSLELAGYTTILYPNTAYNADLLRIQSMLGIMETHGRLNKRGMEIDDILKPQSI